MLSGEIAGVGKKFGLKEAKLIYIRRVMEIPKGGKDKRWGGIWKERERAREGESSRGGGGWG